VRGFQPLGGGYEQFAFSRLTNPHDYLEVGQGAWKILIDYLPSAFLGQGVFPLNLPVSLILLVSAGFMIRRGLVLWGVLILATFLGTVFTSAMPRYYLMVMPLLMLGWLLTLVRASCWIPSRRGAQALLLAGLSLVTVSNLVAQVGFIFEQRSIPFHDAYKNGKYKPTLRLAELIRAQARPGDRILGPHGPILTYLSGASVLTERELFPWPAEHHPERYPQLLAHAGLDLVVFPASIFRDKEPRIARLMERRLIRAVRVVAGEPDLYLAEPRIVIPPVDWRQLPKGWRPDSDLAPTTQKIKKKKPTTTPKRKKKKPAATPPTSAPSTTPSAR
jgi:hypothetical protein